MNLNDIFKPTSFTAALVELDMTDGHMSNPPIMLEQMIMLLISCNISFGSLKQKLFVNLGKKKMNTSLPRMPNWMQS